MIDKKQLEEAASYCREIIQATDFLKPPEDKQKGVFKTLLSLVERVLKGELVEPMSREELVKILKCNALVLETHLSSSVEQYKQYRQLLDRTRRYKEALEKIAKHGDVLLQADGCYQAVKYIAKSALSKGVDDDKR